MSRTELRFEQEASQVFSFLEDIGFRKEDSSPTIVKYRNDNICATIYHGRQSFELGFEVYINDTRYSLSEIIKSSDQIFGETYRNFIATTPSSIRDGISKLRDLVTKYSMNILQGDLAASENLAHHRAAWAKKLEAETKVSSLKYKADEAFRLGCYTEAADLYDQILDFLPPSQLKKAHLARERAAEEGQG